MIWTLWSKCHGTGDLSIWPNLSLKRFNREYLILEMHRIIIYSLANALVLSLKCGDSFFSGALSLLLKLCLVVRIITVKAFRLTISKLLALK